MEKLEEVDVFTNVRKCGELAHLWICNLGLNNSKVCVLSVSHGGVSLHHIVFFLGAGKPSLWKCYQQGDHLLTETIL